MTDGKYHYINKSGKDLGMADEKGAEYITFSEGLAIREQTDFPYVLLDKTGKTLKTLADCGGIFNYSEGIAGVKSASSSLYGFVDIQGTQIIPYAYTGFTGFNDGISRVSKTVGNKTKYGYISSKGEIILPIEYDDVYVFSDGWGMVKKDGNYFFVDKKGTLKEAPRKYDLLLEFHSGMAMGKVNGAQGEPATFYYINTSLKEEFSLQLKEAYSFWDNIAVVKRDKDFELMNRKGEIYKTLADIEQLRFCADGAFAIKKGGKWGFIDSKGKEITANVYDSCSSFDNGIAKVRSGKKWGLVDKTGKEIIAPKYDNLVTGDNGLVLFQDTYWGLLDKTGKILLPPTYFSLTSFKQDRALGKSAKQFIILKAPSPK